MRLFPVTDMDDFLGKSQIRSGQKKKMKEPSQSAPKEGKERSTSRKGRKKEKPT